MQLPDIDLNLIRGLVLLALIVGFVGMWVWAWSSKRKKVFHEASLLPLEEDDGQVPANRHAAGNEE